MWIKPMLCNLNAKKVLREEMLKRRQSIPMEHRNSAEVEIVKLLKQWLQTIPKPVGIMGYNATRGEVDVTPVLDEMEASGVNIFLPRVEDRRTGNMTAVSMPFPWRKHVIRGAYGIAEPLPDLPATGPDGISVVLVPGVVFDQNFARIGFGGGYYDRFLPQLSTETIKVGVAFAAQVVKKLPRDDHDIPLNAVCTEDGLLTGWN